MVTILIAITFSASALAAAFPISNFHSFYYWDYSCDLYCYYYCNRDYYHYCCYNSCYSQYWYYYFDCCD